MEQEHRSKVAAAPCGPSFEPLEARQLLAIGLTIITPLPLLTNDNTPELTGTVGNNDATVQVSLGEQDGPVVGTWDALTDGLGGWTFVVPDEDALADGVYDIIVTAVDEGDLGFTTSTAGLTVDATAPTVTVNALTTKVVSPALTGTVNDPSATVVVTVGGADYPAVNNGGGTWTLAAGEIADLAEGTYDVTVTATDTFGNVGTDASTDELVIDLTPPVVTVDALATAERSPELTGTVDDPAATVVVTVGGAGYAAVNNTDGTWTLAAGQLAPLADGTYDVAVAATDPAGNVGTDATTDELAVDGPPTVTVDPLTTNVLSPGLTGTVDDPAATVVITVDGADYPAVNNGDGTWTLAAGQIADLAEGTYDVVATATDAGGQAGVDSTADELVIDLTAPVVTANGLTTKSTSPALTGTVDDPTATVVVAVDGQVHVATNNGNGTWTLAAGRIAALAEGTYQVGVAATDVAGNQASGTPAQLVVDLTAPVVTFDALLTADRRPPMSGAVDDPLATVTVTVQGASYTAANNGDGTWTLADDAVATLSPGVHAVTVTATDVAGNTGTASGTVSVAGTVRVNLGGGIYSVSFTDQDGTRVTLTAGKGNINVTFTGMAVTVVGVGKGRTVVAAGGVWKVAVDVVQDTSSLKATTIRGGDGLAVIASITGRGILKTLTGGRLVIGGEGVNMLGGIQTMSVSAIAADVAMNSAVLARRGVKITAGALTDCTIQAAYIKALTAATGSSGANVVATVLKSLTVKGGFANSNITAATIGSVTLYNVAADNGGVPFGLTAGSLKKLTLKQGRTTLVWRRDFTTGILDLFVDV